MIAVRLAAGFALISAAWGQSIRLGNAETIARDAFTKEHVTGAQIAVVDRGRMVWSYVYGLRGKTPDLPMQKDTQTWAASITKALFATYVMKLVEREGFDPDQKVWENVTPRMLLSHTSGLLNFASMEPDKQKHLHFTPGTQFNYSGEGFNLLQSVIEERKHQPMDQLMQEALFAPVGMTHTNLVFRPEGGENIADRFDLNEKFIAKTRRAPARAAGSATTTAEDLARFASALFAGKILKPATMRAMLTPQIQIRARHQFGPAEPGTEGAAVGLAYGLGWGLLTKTPFGPAFFKEGHGDGAQNYMICFEKRQACMIILTNSDNGELAFRPLLEKLFGDTVTPWEWEGYTPEAIEAARKNQ